MKRTAKVVGTDGGLATIEVERQSACAGCGKNKNGGCAMCAIAGAGKTFRAQAKNTAGAEVGDTVEIHTPDKSVIGSAALVFLLPVAAALAGYFITDSLTQNEYAPLIVMAAAFAAGVCICMFISKKRLPGADIEIVNIIKDKDI